MQQNLVEDRSQDITAVRCLDRPLDCLRDGCSQAACRGWILCQHDFANIGRVARAGDDLAAKGLNQRFSIRLLLEGDFDHKDGQVNAKVRACHGESRTPLAGTGFGSQGCHALLFGIVDLCGG